MNQKGKGKLYVRVYRPPQDVDKVILFERRMVEIILASSYRPNLFHSPLDSSIIKLRDHFLFLVASQDISEPDIHATVREIAFDCSFTEIITDDEVKKILRESIDRGLHNYIM